MQHSMQRKPRLHFDTVAVAAAKIRLSSVEGFDFYFDLLDACGWTRMEFENEELKRIDRRWTNGDWRCLS
jgi:hypothetical protein